MSSQCYTCIETSLETCIETNLAYVSLSLEGSIMINSVEKMWEWTQ